MLSFEAFLTLLVTTVIFCATVVPSFYIKSKTTENADHKRYYSCGVKISIAITALLLLSILALYFSDQLVSFLQAIWTSFTKENPQPTSDTAQLFRDTLGFTIDGFCLWPFQDGFFTNWRFTYLYSMGAVLSVIILIIMIAIFGSSDNVFYWYEYLLSGVYCFVSAWGLIWLDYLQASLLTVYLPIHTEWLFILATIGINIVYYLILGVVFGAISFWISDSF